MGERGTTNGWPPWSMRFMVVAGHSWSLVPPCSHRPVWVGPFFLLQLGTLFFCNILQLTIASRSSVVFCFLPLQRAKSAMKESRCWRRPWRTTQRFRSWVLTVWRASFQRSAFSWSGLLLFSPAFAFSFWFTGRKGINKKFYFGVHIVATQL